MSPDRAGYQRVLICVAAGALIGAVVGALLQPMGGYAILGAWLGLLVGLWRRLIGKILVGLTLATFVVLVISIVRNADTWERAFRQEMNADLITLMNAEEKYFAAHRTFTSDLTLLDSMDFRPTRVTFDMEADSLHWSATSHHPLITHTCTMTARHPVADSSNVQYKCTGGTYTQAYNDLRAKR